MTSATDFASLDLLDPPAVVARGAVLPGVPKPPAARRAVPKVQDPRFPHIRFLKNEGSLLRDLNDRIGPQVIAFIPTVAIMGGVVFVARHFLFG
jgi:hypothetical protein